MYINLTFYNCSFSNTAINLGALHFNLGENRLTYRNVLIANLLNCIQVIKAILNLFIFVIVKIILRAAYVLLKLKQLFCVV